MSYSAIVMISSLVEDVKNEYLRAVGSQLSVSEGGQKTRPSACVADPKNNPSPNSVGQECPTHTG